MVGKHQGRFCPAAAGQSAQASLLVPPERKGAEKDVCLPGPEKAAGKRIVRQKRDVTFWEES